SMMGDLISSNPGLLSIVGDLFFENSDGPGHLEVAERMKAMLDPKIQQLLASKDQNQNIPPHVQGMIQQLQQRVSEAEKVMQMQAEELKSRQADSQVKLQIAQLQADQAITLQAM